MKVSPRLIFEYSKWNPKTKKSSGFLCKKKINENVAYMVKATVWKTVDLDSSSSVLTIYVKVAQLVEQDSFCVGTSIMPLYTSF